MADWNPTNPDDWSRAFGLVALPYFSRHRASSFLGTHLMMQDGEAASFALHIVERSSPFSAGQLLSWAWSSNVRHAVVFDAAAKTALARRWDDPSIEEKHGIASDRDAKAFVRKIERSQSPPVGEGVIDRTLLTFSLLRTALEERRATRLEIAVAFNAAMLLAETWRNSFDKMPSIPLTNALEQLTKTHPWLSPASLGQHVHDYDIGEFVRIMLEQRQNGSSYLLDSDLLIRHASGLLYQEAHKQLAIPQSVSFVRQRRLFDDAMPSGLGGRHHQMPGSIHHTPPWLARALVELALEHGDWRSKQSLDILDPACGSGVFLIETVRELERSTHPTVRLRGMDISSVAGVMSRFCIGEASRDLANVTPSIQSGVDSLKEDWGQPDIVFMNPPYKAWKDLSAKEKEVVSRVLGKHKIGRPDLYMAFLAKAAESLKPGGILAAVVPSAFFSVDSARKLRDYLYGDICRIRMVGSFGFETFEKAQVETATIVVSKSQIDSRIRIVIAQDGHAEHAVRVLRGTPISKSVAKSGFEIYSIPASSIRNKTGILHRQSDLQFAEIVTKQTTTIVETFFTVHLGIRGIGAKGFEKVLLLGEHEFLKMAPTKAERLFFRPVADCIENGRIVAKGYVFYPYGTDRQLLLSDEKDVAEKVPVFFKEVLEKAKVALQGRGSINRKKGGKATREWWEPSEPVTTWLAEYKPRLVSQEHGTKGNFAFDEDGHYAVVGGHAWCWNNGSVEPDVMFAYLALLNSRIVERLFKVYCPSLQGGQFKLASRFVHRLPLPDVRSGASKLASIGRRIHAGESYDETELDSAALVAYGIAEENDDERKFRELVDEWRDKTGMYSSITKKIEHTTYHKIIAMGDKAIPWILKELRDRPSYWFAALCEISKESPVPPDQMADFEMARATWLTWGKKRGLIT